MEKCLNKVLIFLGVFGLLNKAVIGQGPFAPAAEEPGSTAIFKDSSIFNSWALQGEVSRGYMQMNDTTLGYTTAGEVEYAFGPPDLQTISLGDGGSFTFEVQGRVFNGPGFDFAVFENSFDGEFLELATVAVSSNGEDFVQFPCTTFTSTNQQVGTYGYLDPTNLYGFAGKYKGFYGTPFDLEELILVDTAMALDLQNIRYIRIEDVVGSIESGIGRKDDRGVYINDPFPTGFASGGFDLDALGFMHFMVGNNQKTQPSTQVYPNPANQNLRIEFNQLDLQNKTERLVTWELISLYGATVKKGVSESNQLVIQVQDIPEGTYFFRTLNKTYPVVIAR